MLATDRRTEKQTKLLHKVPFSPSGTRGNSKRTTTWPLQTRLSMPAIKHHRILTCVYRFITCLPICSKFFLFGFHLWFNITSKLSHHVLLTGAVKAKILALTSKLWPRSRSRPRPQTVGLDLASIIFQTYFLYKNVLPPKVGWDPTPMKV